MIAHLLEIAEENYMWVLDRGNWFNMKCVDYLLSLGQKCTLRCIVSLKDVIHTKQIGPNIRTATYTSIVLLKTTLAGVNLTMVVSS